MILYENEAKTRELALSKCLEMANANEHEVLSREEEIKGNLLKKIKYKVWVVTIEEIKEEIKNFITQLSHLMNIKIEAEIKEESTIFKIMLSSDHNSILIGKDGKTMKAIQILLKQSLLSKTNMNIKIHLDVSNYKEKRMKQLENSIKKIASEVIHSKIEVKLDPMNSYERRVVHNLINEYTMLETKSEGEEPKRYIVISYKQD